MLQDNRIYSDNRATRRDCIRQGWDAFQAKGWGAPNPYANGDPRWHFWMNGLEGGAEHRKNIGFDMKQVPGWT